MTRMLTPSMPLTGPAPTPAPPPEHAFETARPALAVRLARLVFLTTLAAAGILLISVSLLPAVFVGLVFFLPALVPFVLLGLSLCAGEEPVRHATDEFPPRDAGACRCAEDDLLRQDPSALGACTCAEDDARRRAARGG